VNDDEIEAKLRKFADDGNMAEYVALRLMQDARNGDWQPLADYLARGEPITATLRRYFIDILRFAKHPKKRTRKVATFDRHQEIAEFVETKKREGVRDPIKKAMRHLDVSKRTVHAATQAPRPPLHIVTRQPRRRRKAG
jgi:hypothetical protein